MGKITDRNVTGRLFRGKVEAVLGDAHQYIVAGILIRLGFKVSILATKGEPYDLLIYAYRTPGGDEVVLRCQTRSSSRSVKFTGGTRGGINRIYKPGVKEYKFTTEHNDLIIAIDIGTLDLYLIPTTFIEQWGKSRAFSKFQLLKNNWEILLNWNNEHLGNLKRKLEQA